MRAVEDESIHGDWGWSRIFESAAAYQFCQIGLLVHEDRSVGFFKNITTEKSFERKHFEFSLGCHALTDTLNFIIHTSRKYIIHVHYDKDRECVVGVDAWFDWQGLQAKFLQIIRKHFVPQMASLTETIKCLIGNADKFFSARAKKICVLLVAS